jgi:DNA-binding PucR family transcriptional regulator
LSNSPTPEQEPAMLNVRKTLAAALVIGATALALPAAAMPLAGLEPAILQAGQSPQIDPVRWVCGPWRCHWAPNYYRRDYDRRPDYSGRMGWGYGPRPYPHPHRDWDRDRW